MTGQYRDLKLDLPALRAAYDYQGLSPLALIDEVLRRVAAGPPRAWIAVLDRKTLLRYARTLERKRRDRAKLPLYGVPFAIKDNIDLAGTATTAGCPAFAYTPRRSAFVVELLIQAGAIPVGKTHLDQFATGLVGTRHPAGPCANAFVPEYIAGGSSSGSALVTALDQVSFALGTDTAGSGRVPAALNDLIGVKPTRGLLSTRGVVPACRSLDCVSIFTKQAQDAREILRVAARFDPADETAREAPRYRAPDRSGKDAFVFGVPRARDLDLDPSLRGLWRGMIRRLEALGGRCVRIDFRPFLAAAKLLYGGPWVAERFAAVGAFIEGHPDAVWPVTRDIILAGKLIPATAAFAAQYRLAELRRQSESLRAGLDFVMTPTVARAYRIAEVERDPLGPNTDLGTYTNFMNLLDLAAIAVPAGRRRDGLPWGVTIFSDAGSDWRLLDFAAALRGEVASLPAVDASALTRVPEPIVVCGAHMSGMALNHQLRERGGRLLRKTRTAPVYRFYALPGAAPGDVARPGLVRHAGADGSATGTGRIAVEVWEMPRERWADFIAGIPAPLAIGSVELADGSRCKGFVCEAWAAQLPGAVDITRLGSWRRYMRGK